MALRRLTSFVSRGSIKRGKLVLGNAKYFRTIIAGYEDTPKVRVIIEPERGLKTRRQLGYYFAVVLPEIARHSGHTVEELDAIFKARFLKKKLMWRGGEMTVITSKADLTSDEMGEYISNVIGEAADMGIEIPDPDKMAVVRKTL